MTGKKRLLSVCCFLIFFVGPLAFIVYAANSTRTPAITNQSSIPAAAPVPTAKSAQQPATDGKLIIGNPAAPVTVIMYGDFQCPFCRQFYVQTEPQIIQAYVTTGKANIEFRVETHIGKESVRAGEAAYCANDQRKFKEYHDQLYDNQNGENDGAFSDSNLKRFAKNIGLNETTFAECLNNNTHLDTVTRSNNEAHQRGVTTTPTIFVGDNKVAGAQPFAIYRSLLDAEL